MLETLYCPTKVHFGGRPPESIAKPISQYGSQGLLLSSPSIPFVDDLMDAFEHLNMGLIPFRKIESDSDSRVAGELTQIARSSQVGFILAAGDEHAMDMGKVVSLFATNPAEPSDLFNEQLPKSSLNNKPLPLVSLPTCPFTLSEAHSSFLLRHQNQPHKIRHRDVPVFSSIAFLMGEWTNITPLEQLKTTLFAMLLVAIDVYLSPSLKSHSALLLKRAIDLINRSILDFVGSPEDPQLRSQFLYASYYLSQAIQHTSLGALLPLGDAIHAVHSDIPKEFAIVVLGTTTMTLQLGSLESSSPKNEDINRSLGGMSKPSPLRTIENINQLADRLRLPRTLRSIGVVEADFENIIDLFWRENIETIQQRNWSKNSLKSLLERTH